MALKIFEKFDPRANPIDGNYPTGSIKNESVPGANDGTPLDAEWGNDYVGATDALLAEVDITPSGNPDDVNNSDRLDALKILHVKNASQTVDFTDVAEYKLFTKILPLNKKVYLADRDACFTVIAGTLLDNNMDIIESDQVDQSVTLTNNGDVTFRSLGLIGSTSTSDMQYALDTYELDGNADTTLTSQLTANSGVNFRSLKITALQNADDGFTWSGDISGFHYDNTNLETNDGHLNGIRVVGGGTGQAGDNSGVRMTSDNGNNPQRNRFEHLNMASWSDACIRFSGGWGNVVSQCRLTNSNIGITFRESSILAGWAGSGQLTYANYYAGNNIAYNNDLGWVNTSINDVMQDNNQAIRSNGNNQIFINTWLENNVLDPFFARGAVVMGGRGWGYLSTLNTDLTVPDEAIVRIEGLGISVFRSNVTPMFDVNGRGVTQMNNIHPGDPQLQRNFRKTSDATFVTIWEVNATNNFNNHSVNLDPEDQLNDNFKTASIRIEGQGFVDDSGTGYGQIVFATGGFKIDLSTPATPFEDQWYMPKEGDFKPVPDGVNDIGSGSQRVQDIYLVNAPTVGSDYRIKSTPTSMSQELLDFALSVELMHFEFKDGTRKHSGVIITEEFLEGLNAVMSLDSCAAFCHEIFKKEDENGVMQPVTHMIHGVELGDLWQVRQDEWQNIMLEAMRRKINAL